MKCFLYIKRHHTHTNAYKYLSGAKEKHEKIRYATPSFAQVYNVIHRHTHTHINIQKKWSWEAVGLCYWHCIVVGANCVVGVGMPAVVGPDTLEYTPPIDCHITHTHTYTYVCILVYSNIYVEYAARSLVKRQRSSSARRLLNVVGLIFPTSKHTHAHLCMYLYKRLYVYVCM